MEQPRYPFEITVMDITAPYRETPWKNRYLLTFIDHFSWYMEAFPIPDQSAETCAWIYTSQIVIRHETGSELITDQGRAFMSSFFQKTCKILGIKHIHTSSFHPEGNRRLERVHRRVTKDYHSM
jgi:transposase InsO family protein